MYQATGEERFEIELMLHSLKGIVLSLEEEEIYILEPSLSPAFGTHNWTM